MEWVEMATALLKDGKYTDPQKAIEYLTNAIRLKPDLVQAYNNRGMAYRSLGRYKDALKDYSEAIRLKPDLAQAYNNRGIVYRHMNQIKKAIGDYSEAIRLKPDLVQAYNNRGAAYLREGNKTLGCIDARRACDLGSCKTYEWAKVHKHCP
jgi:tetratricopeptide (TPR) repeat protein